MKSKITKIQILKKGIALALSAMFLVTPITYATTSLDDSYLESSLLDQLLYGTIGSTVKEIEEWLIENTTLYITNETQLRAFAEYVNNGNDCAIYDKAGKRTGLKEIILLNNIELDKENEWVPIGNENAPFSGIFNGNGYTISGIRIDKENKIISEASNSGLFGYVLGGTIKNVKISDTYIDLNRGLEENYYINNGYIVNVGAIVGYLKNGNILDCKTIGEDSKIKGEDSVGGLVGTVENSTIQNSINEFSVQGRNVIGGIAGTIFSSSANIEANIENCTNSGKIIGVINAGGIAGGIFRGKATIENCLNQGQIVQEGDRTSSCIAGIIGSARGEDFSINNCINEGNIVACGLKAGIAGYISRGTITNCINKGNIQSMVTEDFDLRAGIVVQAGAVTIENCINTGDFVDINTEELNDTIGGIAVQGRIF